MASTISAGTTSGTAIAIAGDTTGALALQTNNGTTAVTIDTSQNVGIGTTSPASKLNIQASSLNYATFSVSGTNKAFFGVDNGSPELVVGASAGDAVIRTQQQLWFGLNGGGVAGRFDSSGVFYMNSGYGSAAAAYGCRAWVNFNGTGTVAIRASGNVSSITDNGTGKYTVNFTTAMPDVNYEANVSVSSMPAVSDANLCVFNDNSGARGDPTTSAIRVSTFNAQFNYLDIAYIYVSIFR